MFGEKKIVSHLKEEKMPKLDTVEGVNKFLMKMVNKEFNLIIEKSRKSTPEELEEDNPVLYHMSESIECTTVNLCAVVMSMRSLIEDKELLDKIERIAKKIITNYHEKST